MNRLVVIVGIVIVGMIVSYFTISSKDVVGYNDKMVAAITHMDETFKPLSGHLEVYADAKPVDLNAFESGVQSVSDSVDRQLADLKAVAVPNDDLCRDFHASAIAYAENNLVYSAIYREKALPYIRAHNPGSDKDVEAVTGMFNEVIAKDDKLMEAVQSRQTDMAKKYRIKLQ
jgi:hypothetical protein